MLIKNLKKFCAIFSLTSSIVLTGCSDNQVLNNGIAFNKKSVSEVLDNVNANYDYEDKYLTENSLNLFIDMDKYDKDCDIILVSDDIDTLVRGIISRIELFSKYVCEKVTTSSNLYVFDDYNSPYKYSDKTFYKILYDIIFKMFENEDKENWNSLYCKLINTAILFSDDMIINDNNTAQTGKFNIRDYELDVPVVGNMIVISEANIDKVTVNNYSFNPNGNYEDIFMYLFYDALTHEAEHCKQNNCCCYYLDYMYLNYVQGLINLDAVQVKCDFLAEAGAVINSEKYYETKKYLKDNALFIDYDEEIQTTKLVESAILLRDDYSVNDIYDNSVSSNPKKLCDWFNVDIIEVGNKTYYDDYAKLFNMLTVLNATNRNNKELFDYIVDKQYGSTNNMNAKKMMMRSDAVTDLMVYSYKNLIDFNEKNNLSYESFNYLVENYQNYYLSQAEFINDFDGLSYWSSEFRVKYEVANNVIDKYMEVKYKNKNKFSVNDVKFIIELKDKMGDKYNVFIDNITNCDTDIRNRYIENNGSLDDIANVKVKINTK